MVSLVDVVSLSVEKNKNEQKKLFNLDTSFHPNPLQSTTWKNPAHLYSFCKLNGLISHQTVKQLKFFNPSAKLIVSKVHYSTV